MKLPFLTHTKKPVAKEKRFNPHHFWIWTLGVFLLVGALITLLSSWFFLKTTERLDAPASPTLATNEAAIASMQKKIEAIDTALQTREGESSSQKESSVVQ